MRGSVKPDSKGRLRGVVDLPREKGEKRKQKYFYLTKAEKLLTPTKQEAALWSKINTFIYEVENSLYLKETNATLEEFLKEWHEVYTGSLAETTKQLYQMYSDVHVCPEIGKLKIKNIKPMQIKNLYNKLSEKLSKNTLGKIHTFLNKVFGDAYKNDLIKINPVSRIEKPRGKKYKPSICKEEHFIKLLELTDGTFDEVCILLAGVCGLRRGEVFGLRLCDIDFNNSMISVRQTMVRFNKEWIIKPPKTEESQRSIKVPKFVVNVISAYLTSLKVVPERICGRYLPDSYSKHFSELLKRNKLPHIRFHDLRHFNAILMLKYGIQDKVAAGRLGHSQVQTLREIYQHFTDDMDTQAAKIIEGVFIKAEEKSDDKRANE